jgi:hypothetical protein
MAISGPTTTVPIAVLENDYVDINTATTPSLTITEKQDTNAVITNYSTNEDSVDRNISSTQGNEIDDARDDSNPDIDNTNNNNKEDEVDTTGSNMIPSVSMEQASTANEIVDESIPTTTTTKNVPTSNTINTYSYGGNIDYRKVKTYVRHLKR